LHYRELVELHIEERHRFHEIARHYNEDENAMELVYAR
jgi:hypothetical protein